MLTFLSLRKYIQIRNIVHIYNTQNKHNTNNIDYINNVSKFKNEKPIENIQKSHNTNHKGAKTYENQKNVVSFYLSYINILLSFLIYVYKFKICNFVLNKIEFIHISKYVIYIILLFNHIKKENNTDMEKQFLCFYDYVYEVMVLFLDQYNHYYYSIYNEENNIIQKKNVKIIKKNNNKMNNNNNNKMNNNNNNKMNNNNNNKIIITK
ncbi:hypothetical protein PFMALIP_00844 [Plasmodium falciparum MaliPS096_E11]|uniref:Uncharacterized protein n=1 Tax=Plasmodium falciparum MaliPS096_E11 TaxID=1036727 RepID=A0A024WXA7_PLAFA|nr:hypothetical protein PFMALIP_00844 [Plasmodium falciparum MaliPS096_E11]